MTKSHEMEWKLLVQKEAKYVSVYKFYQNYHLLVE